MKAKLRPACKSYAPMSLRKAMQGADAKEWIRGTTTMLYSEAHGKDHTTKTHGKDHTMYIPPGRATEISCKGCCISNSPIQQQNATKNLTKEAHLISCFVSVCPERK